MERYENVYDAIFTESEQARLISELNVELAEKTIALTDAQELYAQCKAKLERAEEVIKKIANGGYTGASFLAMEYFKQ